MQSKQELEKFYQNEDPWKFSTTPDDHHRKDEILKALKPYAPFKRALDIGAGEGWVTQYLPAKEIHGIELSETAKSRFPKNVKAVDQPQGFYDLVISTGTLYHQYDWKQMLSWIKQYSKGIILISGIKNWLVDVDLGKPIYEQEFVYREYRQAIRVYKHE